MVSQRINLRRQVARRSLSGDHLGELCAGDAAHDAGCVGDLCTLGVRLLGCLASAQARNRLPETDFMVAHRNHHVM